LAAAGEPGNSKLIVNSNDPIKFLYLMTSSFWDIVDIFLRRTATPHEEARRFYQAHYQTSHCNTEQPHSFSQLITFLLIPSFVEDAFDLQAHPDSPAMSIYPCRRKGRRARCPRGNNQPPVAGAWTKLNKKTFDVKTEP
jgi:hypothetical protein